MLYMYECTKCTCVSVNIYRLSQQEEWESGREVGTIVLISRMR